MPAHESAPHRRAGGSGAPWTVRSLVDTDFGGWRGLWGAYLDFYRESVDEGVARHTFERLCAGEGPMFGVVAELQPASGGRGLVGIAHGLIHPSTWSTSPTCYLEDLFVAPEGRGTGAARALVEEVTAEARRRGADRLYWMTQEFNGPARSLYDQIATRASFVVYERELHDPT